MSMHLQSCPVGPAIASFTRATKAYLFENVALGFQLLCVSFEAKQERDSREELL